MRTVAGKRPAETPETYTGPQVAAIVESYGFSPDIALRIVAIARTFGIKSEAVPSGGVITVRFNGAGYTISDRMELL